MSAREVLQTNYSGEWCYCNINTIYGNNTLSIRQIYVIKESWCKGHNRALCRAHLCGHRGSSAIRRCRQSV